jgi:peptidoglycan-associated lipoprotein
MTRQTLIVLAACAVLAGCRRDPTPAPAPAPAAAPASAPTATVDPNAAARAAAEAAEREAQRIRAALEERIFFDYDEIELRPEARQALDAKAQVLRESPAIRLRIEGHADERGSTEYNIALGSRRATSVLSYLTGFGLPASRFEVASYGEERPLARGENEQAWGQNRRAEFVITGGVSASR